MYYSLLICLKGLSKIGTISFEEYVSKVISHPFVHDEQVYTLRKSSVFLQRRQGHNPRPLCFLVGTPSALWRELASRRVEHSLLWRITFWSTAFITLDVCVMISWARCFCWLLVLGLYKEDYLQIFNVCPFDYMAFAVSGKVGIPLSGLTAPVEWLSSLQLTVLSRSAIVV